MKKIVLLILLGIGLSWDSPPAFKNNKETKFDSLYNRYNLLMLEVYDVRKSLYELQKSFGNISDIADTTDNIKNKISLLEENMNYEIQKMKESLDTSLDVFQYKMRKEQVQYSSQNQHINDLEDRFFTFRSTSKVTLKRLKENNATLLDRVNKLETELNSLKNQNKEK